MVAYLQYRGGRASIMSSSTAQATANGGVWRGTGRVWSVHAQGDGKRRTTASRRGSALARPGHCLGALTACVDMSWHGTWRAKFGQVLVSLCLGLIRACSGECREAS
jgi:hypothetical protein